MKGLTFKRTPLNQRSLPNYSRGNEIANMTTHILGGAVGMLVLILSVCISLLHQDYWALAGGSIFGLSMIALYSVSSIYHGLRPGLGKKVMQVIDHCTIYLLITGSYTPILLSALRPASPTLAWGLFAAEWGIALVGIFFTALDHKRYGKLSMVCYIGMGWLIMLAARQTYAVLGKDCFLWLLSGGISYTIGAVMYGLGKKKPGMHTIFHLFVDLGSICHAVAILGYVL